MNITPELIRSAVACIPANLPRDEWARIGMAIKSEFPDDTGLELFQGWSATSDTYDQRATASTWRSIKGAGGVGIGTLLHEAKARGFELPHEDRPRTMAETLAEDARRTQERAARLRAEEERRQAAHAEVAAQANALWDESPAAIDAGYLQRKGVLPFGVRATVDGWLLVPLRDAEGALWNVQRIAPAKPQAGPDKLFLKNGRKSGLWHWCGDPTGAAVLLQAEGYATAATLHEATGRPVAVAFDAGNLGHVARAISKLHPDALLVVCGDDDAGNPKNPGRDKAEAAARAARGLSVFPEGLPEGGTDFNDMHQHAGLDAVRALVEGAIARHQTPAPVASHGDAGTEFDPFHVDGSGVWFTGIDQDGKRRHPEWVCSRLDVAALTRDQDGHGWGYLLQFTDPLGHEKQWAMPARMLAGDGGEYRAALLNMGLRIASGSRVRNLLTQYVQTRTPSEYAQCTDRIGWHGAAFVLPRETIGDDAERIVFQSDSQMENTFRARGSADQWRDRVGVLCAGNSRLVFAVSCAFAGPLLRPAGMESGGFHLRGDSSSGKTTALKLAASVYGGTNYLQRWRTTDNALEAIAAQHCDSLLILDELAQVDPKTAGECAYMLANEQSKARATRAGMARARLAWRLLFLSAGELGLADHMAEGSKRARTGQEVRMADIPADAGAGLGMFEDLHDFNGGANFARHLVREATACYGAPGHAFITWATQHADTLAARVRRDVAAAATAMVPGGASGQVERVGARFALAGVAGELATEAGLTGWQPGEANRGAAACFAAWMDARGGAGNGEELQMLRAVRRFLESHGEGRFTWWHRAADDHSAKTLQRAGYRRMLSSDGTPIKSNSQHGSEFGDRMPTGVGEGVTVEYFVLPEVFRAEVCAGFDYKAVARVLLAHECLVAEEGRIAVTARLPGLGKTKCYRVTAKLFELDV